MGKVSFDVEVKLYHKLGFREVLDVNQDEYGTYLLKKLRFYRGDNDMLEINFDENFEELDRMADKLLSDHDAENGVEYNFNKFSFVAKDDDEPVGFCTGFSYYSEVTINNVIVLKEYRSKGIGTKLIESVEKYFEGKGFNNINLVTNNFQAPKFYEKCGFTLEFVRKNKTNPKLTKYFFVKYF